VGAAFDTRTTTPTPGPGTNAGTGPLPAGTPTGGRRGRYRRRRRAGLSTTDAVDHRSLHDEENVDLSALLHDLEPSEWEQPSLCDGWRVRDVVGHILDGTELNLWTLPFRLARFGFSSDRSGRLHSILRVGGLRRQPGPVGGWRAAARRGHRRRA